jgi:hypothetical protein
MTPQKPRIVAIDHDEYYAEHVGRTADGRQFFVTTPFIAARGDEAGREFLAVYFFDESGKFLDALIDDLGSRSPIDGDHVYQLRAKRLEELQPFAYGRIQVQPFQVERFGTTFGLVPRPPEDDQDGWWVEVLPGNYMAFHEPWESGEYDT